MARALVKSAALMNGNLANPVLTAANWRLRLAVGFYGIAFLFQAAALSRLPLNIARPITTAWLIIVVGLASMSVLGERVPVGPAVGNGRLFANIFVLAAPAGR